MVVSKALLLRKTSCWLTGHWSEYLVVAYFQLLSSSAALEPFETQSLPLPSQCCYICRQPLVAEVASPLNITLRACLHLSDTLKAQTPLAPSGSSKESTCTEGGKSEAIAAGKVTGLKGRGKSRVVFELRMAMERARVFCNNEDGSQFAMLEQEFMAVNVKVCRCGSRFVVEKTWKLGDGCYDLAPVIRSLLCSCPYLMCNLPQMFPASMRVNASLGNFRLCNLQLPTNHPWRWFCNLRDTTSKSLVVVSVKCVCSCGMHL